MPRPTYAPVRPSVREEIEQALRGRGGIRIAATAKYLAHQLGLPVRAVRDEMEMMGREGLACAKRLRTGEVLYKMLDGARPIRVTLAPQEIAST